MNNQCKAILDEIKQNIEALNPFDIRGSHYSSYEEGRNDMRGEILAMIDYVVNEWSNKNANKS